MRRITLKEELMKMRFNEVCERYQSRALTTEEAADILGISARTFLRKRNRMNEDDFNGSFDKRLGKRSNNRAEDEEIIEITKLYNERYNGFSVKHFYDWVFRHHNITRSYSWCHCPYGMKHCI